MEIKLNNYQLKMLIHGCGSYDDEDGETDWEIDGVTLAVGDESWHSGPGLYVIDDSNAGSGSLFLAVDEQDEARALSVFEAKVASGELATSYEAYKKALEANDRKTWRMQTET
jgi:hypothetical protein